MKYKLLLTSLTLFITTAFTKANPPKQIPLDSVETLIYELGFKYPDIVLLQVKVESAHLTSNLARNHNNVTGMKVSERRGNTSIGSTRSQFANYKSIRESLIDRLLLEYWSGFHKLSRQEYLNKMRTIYCHNCGSEYLF